MGNKSNCDIKGLPEVKLPPGQVLRRASVKFSTQGASSQSLCGSRKEVLEELLQNKVLWGI